MRVDPDSKAAGFVSDPPPFRRLYEDPDPTLGILGYMSERLRELSTWRGIVGMLTALGVAIAHEHVVLIVSTGLGVMGLIGALAPDKLEATKEYRSMSPGGPL